MINLINMTDENQQKSVFKDDATQRSLNTPLQDSTGSLDGKDQEFLNLVISLIDDKKIDLYQPSTLINSGIYDKLDDLAKGKVDLESINMLAGIREMKGLYDNGFQDTYQMANLVHRLRLTKERLEETAGDVFII